MEQKNTVRIHGQTDPEKLKKATLSFLEKVEQQKRKVKQNENQ